MIALRPYQLRALDCLRAEIRNGNRAVLLVLPTGGGKTVLALEMVRRHIASGGRVLFLAHRTELIRQSAATFVRGGIPSVRIIQAGKAVGDRDAPVTVASIPTLATDKWLANLPTATLVIFDECHHTRAESWQKIAEHYKSSVLIGLTATPERADGKALGDIFKAIVVCSTVRELTDLGYLVPCSVLAPAEYRQQLADDPVDAYMEHGAGRRALIFCPTVAHARKVAEDLVARGVPAACVDGKIAATERARHLERFREGALRVVTNVAVLTEGFDDPGVEVCILARACDHVGLYLQIIGRVLRPAPGKESALFVDLRGAVHKPTHGLPDDPREYSLEGEAIRTLASLPLKQCKRCGYCSRAWKKCPECDWQQADPEPPEVRRERLQRVFATHGDDQKSKYWQSLQAIAQERGYHRNWCSHRFAARYGHPFGGRAA